MTLASPAKDMRMFTITSRTRFKANITGKDPSENGGKRVKEESTGEKGNFFLGTISVPQFLLSPLDSTDPLPASGEGAVITHGLG